MRRTFRKFFIPHQGNNFHPHILHAKRALFYSAVFLLVKIIMVGFVLFLPNQAFVLPDVLAAEGKKLLILTNELRVKNGLPVLKESNKLDNSSDFKARDMATGRYFGHTGPKNNLANWLGQVGYNYRAAGENLAVGFSSAEDIMKAWEKSPSHLDNLLDKDYQELGVGVASGWRNNQSVMYIAQHFGEPVMAAENNPESKITTAGELDNDKGMNPIQKYFLAKDTLSPITGIFEVSSSIYLLAIIFFVFALILNIMIEYRRQHPHVIVQTVGLISLLICFWLY